MSPRRAPGRLGSLNRRKPVYKVPFRFTVRPLQTLRRGPPTGVLPFKYLLDLRIFIQEVLEWIWNLQDRFVSHRSRWIVIVVALSSRPDSSRALVHQKHITSLQEGNSAIRGVVSTITKVPLSLAERDNRVLLKAGFRCSARRQRVERNR